MKRLVPSLTLSVSLGLIPWAAGAQQVQPLDPPPAAVAQATEDAPGAWFVELQGAPIADGGSPADLAQEKQAFRTAARRAGVAFEERYSYDTLFNGLSIGVSRAGLAKLTRLTEVKAVYPVVEVKLPETQPDPEPDLSTALAMTQADIAQSELGLTGRGIRVALMDTGIDINHPDLGGTPAGCFGPGCRIEMGYDFVGDAYNNDSTSPAFNPVPAPDAVPDDCAGHGTHVAGIVGANGVVRGVAPEVTFHAYRVFGCAGSTSSDIMVAAMERILADGADVLNMSIGSAFQWPQYPTAQAANRLVNEGIVVVASAGNNGGNGLYSLSAPSVGEKVISVANFDNTHLKLPVITASPDNLAVGYAQASGAPPAPLSGSALLARTGTPTSPNDACNAVAPAPGSLSGRIALIRRGTCSFFEKVTNAQAAGASGVLIYNNTSGLQSISVAGTPPVAIPVVSITAADGVTLNNRIASGPVTLTWTMQTIAIPIANGNRISSSSAYGVSPDLTLKPDIGAPGGSIRSTYPLELGGYANLTGTSMSSPHVAGAAALLLEARPHTPPNAVRGIFLNYADPHLWWGNPGLGLLDNVHRQGAGMLRIADAVRGTLNVEPDKLSLGESEAGPATRTLTVSNRGTEAVTLDLSQQSGLATGTNTFTPTFFVSATTVAWSAPTLTVPAGGTATVDVTITADAALPDHSLYGGWLVLTPQGGGREVRVPYSGFKGDYQSIQVLVPTPNGYPWLAKLSGTTYLNQPAGATYTLQGTDVPFFLVHLDHQARALLLEVFDAATGRAWHRALSTDYLGRNSGAATFFAISWDGVTTAGGKSYTVPDGSYVVRMTVRKALGGDSDVETWTSPVITIARP